jgi:hypothetical protein
MSICMYILLHAEVMSRQCERLNALRLLQLSPSCPFGLIPGCDRFVCWYVRRVILQKHPNKPSIQPAVLH